MKAFLEAESKETGLDCAGQEEFKGNETTATAKAGPSPPLAKRATGFREAAMQL
jgi:hypothetical protein